MRPGEAIRVVWWRVCCPLLPHPWQDTISRICCCYISSSLDCERQWALCPAALLPELQPAPCFL